MTVILLREVLLEMGVPFKSSDTKTKLVQKVVETRSKLNLTCDENTEVAVAPTSQENVILRDNPTAISNLHCTKHDSSGPATKKYFSCDFETHLNIDNNFKILVACDFDLRKKIILLIHVIFLL